MNKIVKGLAVASLLMTAQLANADDLSVAEWKQEIDQVFRPTVDAAFERWVVTDEAHATIERQPINAIRMYNLMRNIRYNEVWNDFIKRYPDSKNGRIAMCEYAKSGFAPAVHPNTVGPHCRVAVSVGAGARFFSSAGFS